MSPDAAKYLWDAQQAAAKALRFVQGKGFDDYLADELLRSAVERQLEIVGEALSQLRKADPATASTIPDLPVAQDRRRGRLAAASGRQGAVGLCLWFGSSGY